MVSASESSPNEHAPASHFRPEADLLSRIDEAVALGGGGEVLMHGPQLNDVIDGQGVLIGLVKWQCACMSRFAFGL